MNTHRDLEDLLDHIQVAANRDLRQMTVATILEASGTRSFSPLLMLVGLLVASPLSGIPFFPTLSAAIVLAVSLQILLGREHFWLPGWLLRRTLPGARLKSAIEWLKPGARFVDRLIRPRLSLLVRGPGKYPIALTCLLIAATMPLMELIPFSSSVAGLTLCAFGLALASYDGILALAAYVTTVILAGLVIAGFS
jgi:hypothetical protein